MSKCFIVADGAGEAVDLAAADEALGQHQFVWYRLDGRDAAARAWLDAQDTIPQIARTALVAQETRPRTDTLATGALINLRGPGATPEDDPDALVSIRLWAERGRVISMGFRTLTAMERIERSVCTGQVVDPGDLITEIATAITEELDPDVAELGDSLDEIESALLETGQTHGMRRTVSKARATAIAYRRFVAPQHEAIERLARLRADWLDDTDREHLREAANRAARMAEELEAVRERAALMHDEITDLRGEQMNQHALLLSIVALVFLPLTFLTGLLGMNVAGIPYAEEPWAFWGVVGICVGIAVGISAYFARAHWLQR